MNKLNKTFKINPLLLTDSYKISHHYMYPEGTEKVYSNMTARSDKYAPDYSKGGIISFFQQATMRIINNYFKENFFDLPKDEAISSIKKDLSDHINGDYDVTHFEALHDLQYLPIKVKAIPEGMFVPIKVPFLTIINTDDRFYWLVNYLETIISNTIWHPITVATIIKGFKNIGNKWYNKNDKDNKWFLDFCFHNFAMRGMSGLDSAVGTGLAFAIHSKGSDTLPVIHYAREYYDEKGCSVFSLPATEHAVASSNIIFNSKDILENRLEGEKQFLKKLITEIHPTGMVSYVADTYDLWSVVTEILPSLKDDIMTRNGKLIIRPDSSPTTPADIICGINVESYDNLEEAKVDFSYLLHDNQVHGEADFEIDTDTIVKVGNSLFKLTADVDWNRYDKQYYFIENINIESQELELNPSNKGVVELLWDIFGGTVNEQGYKILDSHIGFIYGEGISQDMLNEIYARLDDKGFAASNVVVGMGSFSQIFCSRDTYGQAIKATAVQIKGELHNIYKDPKTSGNFNKKSAKGLMCVNKDMTLKQECTWEEESQGLLQTIYENGQFFNQNTLTEIRERINKSL